MVCVRLRPLQLVSLHFERHAKELCHGLQRKEVHRRKG